MNIFYTPNITATSNFVLDETESKHAIKVLRLNQGDKICLVDGTGTFYTAEIINAHAKKCEVKIFEKNTEENNKPIIHIAIAPTKNNDRLEWFIEKTTEIGITTISPIICDHSERKVLKTERLEKRAISAMKQSLKATLPIINEAVSFKSFIDSTSENTEKYIAHCYDEHQQHLKEIYTTGKDCLVLIGPEGDFSLQEIELALKNGFKPISLGKSRLRTETAGLIACNILNLLNE
ncbi:MAG: 16S rRNA (uracil(1498)-N(3))-methyltransferase [Flavobacteriales bacterium]|nr:16S rRNA (uracil(1498)-N(3))-methyltransferase [Flavobacteriales bacterium]MCB9364094.1 16S rRNA (uracil(1498)-N(3))-methyltransferase [Flavobacteriales bacterium]